MNKIKSIHHPVLVEVLNAATHGIGVIFGIVGMTLLIYRNIIHYQYQALFANMIYGICFISLFLASTLYHSFSFTPLKKLMRRIDHSAIFLMIAGSYTPYCLITLNDTKAKLFCLFIWLLAITGIVIKNFIMNAPEYISAAIYLVLGWLSVLLLPRLIGELPTISVQLLFAGGVVYSLGTLFYIIKKWPIMHVVWHLFVLGGAILIFCSIYIAQTL
ncbi:PAQR family membrane homeostasis protein TrhA [Atopobacter phocae]|uniref:PAQR family membrane homeostasis protein TrhA n=1 Tax=Atopobacter phocae TaxID=136492 RepID=UPI000472D30C|nr:hemolysin III family protein [Atopobacter phocae]